MGDVDDKALRLSVEVGGNHPTLDQISTSLLVNVTDPSKKKYRKQFRGIIPPSSNNYFQFFSRRLGQFIEALYGVFADLCFSYLEINPLVVTDGGIFVLDMAAKIDATADFLCRTKWGEIDYPPPFGRDAYPEEAYIADLDSKSGASLKLTILNPSGRIWTMVAGGGASVIYADTICDLDGASELANYGEYSGAPTESQTFEYAKTILGLMTSTGKHPDGKVIVFLLLKMARMISSSFHQVLIIGGGIANFTNVAATFKGIVKALVQFRANLVEHSVSIFVRRAGPNYQEGLRLVIY